MTAGLSLEVVDSAARLDPQEWDALVEQARSPLFYRHGWLTAYEEAAPEEIAGFHYLLLRQPDGGLGAGLPSYLVTSSPFWGGYAIESGFSDPLFSLPMLVSPCWYAFHTVLCSVLPLDQALPLLLEALEGLARGRGTPLLAFPSVPEGHPLLPALLQRGFLAACIDAGHVCPQGRLSPGFDLKAFLGLIEGSERHDMVRRVRRSLEAGARFSLELGPHLVDAFVALTDATCRKHGIQPLYTTSLIDSLRRHLSSYLFFANLQAEGRLLGGFLGFKERDLLYLWCGGIDIDQLPRFSTYVVTFYHTLQWAMESGCRVIDMGRGNHKFKMKHGFRPLRLYLCLKALDPSVSGRLPEFMARLEAGLGVPSTLEHLEARYGTFATAFYAPRPGPGQPY
ncbi:MAG: GNAT family N-acetyltransferase [Acetobacteraceae bacterium]|nr:GNAT family N-acetyltransferase [Acetobacteraceae bacterium]